MCDKIALIKGFDKVSEVTSLFDLWIYVLSVLTIMFTHL